MFFTLPKELRARIWAQARFFTASTNVSKHLVSRARCIDAAVTSSLAVRLCVGDHKRLTLYRYLGSNFIFEQCCSITRDVFPVKLVYYVGDRIHVDLHYFQTTTIAHAVR